MKFSALILSSSRLNSATPITCNLTLLTCMLEFAFNWCGFSQVYLSTTCMAFLPQILHQDFIWFSLFQICRLRTYSRTWWRLITL
ncbi:hypothetical protein V6N11_032750 [Hibiscus sabdariffa]|uniref:Uncharacterized protein n=1 Tax=Hibiscus sabdariffa TaxID=183260 RepID=A0ABR2T1V1_9ROSI